MTVASAPRWLSLQEAADHVGMSVKTLRRMISAGNLPAYRLGKAVRIKPEDLEATLQRIPTTSIL